MDPTPLLNKTIIPHDGTVASSKIMSLPCGKVFSYKFIFFKQIKGYVPLSHFLFRELWLLVYLENS